MTHQKRRRKKHGVAMVVALMTVFLVMVMATTYLGMSFTNSKAASGYEREAMALSLANAGTEVSLNIMGDPRNWERTFTNAVASRIVQSQSALQVPQLSSDFNATRSQGAPKINLQTRPITRTETNTLFSGFPGLSGVTIKNGSADVTDVSATMLYNQNPVVLGNADSTSPGENPEQVYIGHWQIVIRPVANAGNEIVARYGMTQDNLNYGIAVRAMVFRVPFANRQTSLLTNSGLTVAANAMDSMVASRSTLTKVSYSFPGSTYQNLRAYDAPVKSMDGSVYNYPNMEEGTHDAVFIAEDFEWDGGLRVDGHRPSKNNKGLWGAAQRTATFSDSVGSNSGWLVGNNGQNGTLDTSGSVVINYITSKPDAKVQIKGNISTKYGAQTKVSGEDHAGLYVRESGVQKAQVKDSAGLEELKNQSNFKDKLDITATTTLGEATSGINEQFWMTADGNSKLNSVSGTYQGTEGALSKLTAESGGKGTWHFNNSAAQAKPDPMYGNTTMEAPTYKVTITPSTDKSYDKYTVEQLSYVLDGSNGYKEQATTISTFDSNNKNFPGVIYFAGSNVQVEGEASQSVTIVSDTNAQDEAAMAKAGDLKQRVTVGSGSETRAFDGRLTSPNIMDSSGKYQYADFEKTDNGYEISRLSGASGIYGDYNSNVVQADGKLTETAKPIFAETGTLKAGTVVYPSSNGQNVQPTGNLSIVGDLKYAEGVDRPVVAVVAKNHVYLNDKSHKAGVITPNEDSDINVLEVDALVASEKHSMSMDFSNFSKNLKYTEKDSVSGKISSTPTEGMQNGMELTLSPEAERACSSVPSSTNGGWLTKVQLSTKHRTYINKYNLLSPAAKAQVHRDYIFGAYRDFDNNKNENTLYQGGMFKFNGAVISRFADVEADGGVFKGSGNEKFMGYHWQKMSYDRNLLKKSAPFFSTAGYGLGQDGLDIQLSNIRWSVVSFVDKGSISF